MSEVNMQTADDPTYPRTRRDLKNKQVNSGPYIVSSMEYL